MSRSAHAIPTGDFWVMNQSTFAHEPRSDAADHERIRAVVRESFDTFDRSTASGTTTAAEDTANMHTQQLVHAEPGPDYHDAETTHRERVTMDAATYRARLQQQHAEMHARYTNVDATIERLVALRILEKLARAATIGLVSLGTYAAGMQARRWIDAGIVTPGAVGLVLSVAALLVAAIVANVGITKAAEWARAKATA